MSDGAGCREEENTVRASGHGQGRGEQEAASSGLRGMAQGSERERGVEEEGLARDR